MVACSQKKMKYWKTANTVNIGKLSSSLCHCLAVFVLSLVSVLGFSHASCVLPTYVGHDVKQMQMECIKYV